MKKLNAIIAIFLLIISCTPKALEVIPTFHVQETDWSTPFERDSNYTATHDEVVAFYQKMDKVFDNFQFREVGMTDVGRPLHLGIVSMDKDFDAASLKEKGKCIMMVNNAIHPGEPTGVDATMMLVRDILTKKQNLAENTVLIFIPMYNIGGALNRGSYSRANQNGPAAYGFRGNVRNYDLNRDFIKCDTKNARTFNQVFTEWRPHVFVDNHTSNGADYQYIMTLIPTHHNKLPKNLADFMNNKMLPHLYSEMEKTKYEMTPYVYARNTPDDGIAGFLDLPRYSSGYAALFNTLSFMPEAHMLKPYHDRVKGTYQLMTTFLDFIEENHIEIIENRKQADEAVKTQTDFAVNWELNMDEQDKITFKGYEAKYKPSKVSGKERLYYDRSQPYVKSIPFFNTYKPTTSLEKPFAYIIPQGYDEVIERLQWNGVETEQLAEDKEMEVEVYYIKDHKTGKSPYEGHYLHRNVTVDKKNMKIQYYKGDYVVKTNQVENQYIVHTLEPQAADAFFAWNFFDAIFQQKEYFSPYVFEDVAAQLLEDNPDLKKQLEEKKAEDEKFADSAYAQLLFIYRNSPYYEQTHLRYPVGRLVD